MKYALVASALLLCMTAIGNASAQGIQVRKQTKEIPLPAPAKPKPVTKQKAKPTESVTPEALTATQLFNVASPSVVVLEAMDKNGNTLVTGSGVVFAHGEVEGGFRVATNCHVVDVPGRDGLIRVYHGEDYGTSGVIARDAKRDLCLLTGMLFRRDAAGEVVRPDDMSAGIFVPLPAPPVAQVAPLRSLEVDERVYAIGAPQGLELSLSEGLVSGLRKDGDTTLIQTTAAISKGSSGGGLFDAQGRLVGITTMYLKDGQNLNFAIPAELIASVPEVGKNNVQPVARTPEPVPQSVEKPASPRDRWVEVGGSERFTSYVDTQTIRRSGTDATVWVKYVYDRPTTSEGDTYDEVIFLKIYHCAAHQQSMLSMTRRLGGKVVWSHELKSYEIERKNIMPDTVGESELGAVCNDL